jgi:hypothetical protein
MQRSGLEWLFRLISEPRRLAWRYLIGNTLFIAYAFLQVTGLRSYRRDWEGGTSYQVDKSVTNRDTVAAD